MRENFVIFGVSSDKKCLVIGDREGKPYTDESVAEKFRARCAEDHPSYDFMVLPIQNGPMRHTRPRSFLDNVLGSAEAAKVRSRQQEVLERV